MSKISNSDNPWSEMSRLNLPKSSKPSIPEEEPVSEIKSPIGVPNHNPTTVVAAGIIGGEIEKSEEVVQYSLEELEGMSLKELQAIAKDAGVDFKGLTKEDLIEAIVEESELVVDGSEEEVLLSDDEEVDGEEIDSEMSLEEALKLLGEDSETEDDNSEVEFEEVELEVLEGEVQDDTSSN